MRSFLKRTCTLLLAAGLCLSGTACQKSDSAAGSSTPAASPEGTPAQSEAPAAGDAKDQVLNIFTWANYFPDDIIADFTAETGIRVNYSTFESNEEMLMKIQAGGDYDLVLASDYIIDMARQQNLLLPLDKSKVSNYENLSPLYLGKYYDEKNEYTVPYAPGVPLIVYDPALVGDVKIKGYADLWNPEFADNVVVVDDARNIIGITLKMMGKSMNETDPAVLAEAEKKLMELRPNIRAFDYSTPYELMISGETAVGYMFTSQVNTALAANPNLQVVFPEEGLGFGIDCCFIPAAAPHADNAHAFLNFILDGKRSAHITDQILYPSCNAAAKEYLTQQAVEIPADAVSTGEFIKNIGDAAELYNDIWTRVKQG